MAFATSKTVAYLKIKNGITNDGCMIQSQGVKGECASGVGCILDGQDNRDRLNNHYCVADVATNGAGQWSYNIPKTMIVDHTVWLYMGPAARLPEAKKTTPATTSATRRDVLERWSQRQRQL